MARGYHFTEWPYLYRTNPDALRQGIRDAMIAERAQMPKVWKMLRVSGTMFYAYVRRLGMREEVADLRRALLNGRSRNHRRGSRPVGVEFTQPPRPRPQSIFG